MMNKQYVYKYINQSGVVVYVGITNNIKKRIAEHKHDKLSCLNNPKIMYFPVRYRHDAEMLETYLINSYGTGKHFNVLKKDRGDVSFLGNLDELPWVLFDGTDKDLEPFVISRKVEEKIVEVEKIKYLDENESLTTTINRIWQEVDEAIDYFDEEIDTEEQIINGLTDMANRVEESKKNNLFYNLVTTGIALHKERLEVLNGCLDYYKDYPFAEGGKQTLIDLLAKATDVKKRIDEHESYVRSRKKKGDQWKTH